MLLMVLPQYSKVSRGACCLISHLHMLSILMKNFHKTLHKQFFTITWQNNFFLAWTDLSCAFDFRICFGKALVAFNFNEKLTQSLAQITVQYPVSKDFLSLYFAVDQVLSISGYDLENGRMLCCKQKYWIKNTAVKIPILNLFHFCLLFYLSILNHFRLF